MTLSELLVVVMILGLLVGVVQINLFGVFYRHSFEAAVEDFMRTLEMAADAAARSPRHVSVVVDMDEGTYTLREVTNGQLYDVDETEIVDEASFGDNCKVLYVEYDDGDVAASGTRGHLVAGRAGWMYGAKIVMEDGQGGRHTVVLDRLNRKPRLVAGEVDLLPVRDAESMLF